MQVKITMGVGYFTLHRKLKDNPLWLSETFTRGQAWVDMIMLANFADGFVRVRGVKVAVKRGEVAWSENALAERWKWSRGKVRRFLGELEAEQQIVPQKNNVTSLNKIVNYDNYQPDNQKTVQQTDNKRYSKPPSLLFKEKEEERRGDENSSINFQIQELKNRYTNGNIAIIESAITALATTRKTGKIADSVILSIMKGWDRYPVPKVVGGIETYLDKDYAGDGKGERYLLGIIRNYNPSNDKKKNKAEVSTWDKIPEYRPTPSKQRAQ